MKKVKTIISSLFILLASAFMTACSCSGAGNVDPGSIVQVYETGIDITCDHQSTVKNEETGYLTIRLHLNEEFKITYDLSPLNVTTTQVDWNFVTNDDVAVSKNNSYSYAQSKTHTITFVAKKVGNTKLQFKTKATEKITEANIIVGEAPQVLPKFVEITKYDYNPETGKVSWLPVTQQKLHTGQVVTCPTNNGQVNGLTGYELKITDLTNDVDLETVRTDKCEYELPKGVTYAFKARAIGDGYGDGYGFTVSDGEFPKDAFKFHQLATATELANNNGLISYKSPVHAYQNRVYFNKTDSSMFKLRSNANPSVSTVDKFKYNEIFELPAPTGLNEYSVSIQSFPNPAIFDANKGYALDNDTGIRYYPSLRTEAISIQKLEAPFITMTDKLEVLKVADQNFGEGTEYKPHASSIINWAINKQYSKSEHDVKYAYAVYKNETRIIPSNSDYLITENTSFDTSTLWKMSTPGQYKIEVYTVGKESTTIESSKVTYYFNLLGKIDKDETVIADNQIITSPAIANVAGADLFFIHKSDPAKSVYVNVSGFDGVEYKLNHVTFDITSLNLVPGSYDVYGKYVGIKGNGTSITSTSTTGDVTLISNQPIVVASPTSYNEISSDGVIKFAKVNGISEYIINVNKFNGGSSTASFSTQMSLTDGNHSATNIYRDYEDIRYTQDGEYNYVNIYDIIGRYILRNNSEVDMDNIEQALNAYLKDSSFNYSIISKGAGQNGVDSSTTSAVQFSRVQSIGNLSLNNDVVSFASAGNVSYVIEFNGKTYIQPATSGTISIDFATTMVDGNTLLSLVDKNGSNIIKISVIGTTGKAGSPGLLNSITSETSFRVTEKATDVFALSNGDIVWSMVDKTPNIADDTPNRNFTLKIYDAQGNLLESRKITPDIYEAPLPPVVEPEVPEEGEEESGEPEAQEETGNEDDSENTEETEEPEEPELPSTPTRTHDQYVYNITELINTLYAEHGNIVLAISVEEVDASKFTGLASEPYYVQKLADIEMSRVNIGNNPAIEFNAIEGLDHITYTLTVTKDEDIDNATTFEKVVNGQKAQYLLSELGIINIGKYVIGLVASRDNSLDENSSTTPFVLSNNETTIEAKIISSLITTKTNGQNITWTSIHANANYSVAYKELNGTFTSPEDIGSLTTYEVFSKLNAGTYVFTVTPSIDYLTTGIIFTTEGAQENTVIKLPTVASASDFTTENGALVFSISDTLIENIDVNIVLKSNGAVVPASDYSVVRAGSKFTVNIASDRYQGENQFAVSITSVGYVNSEVSDTYSATKILATSNIVKNGEWIEWDFVENATEYQIKFVQQAGSSPVIITLEYDDVEGIKYKYILDNQEYSQADSSVVKIENRQIDASNTKKVIMYKFDETMFVDGMSGTYEYTVATYTNKVGYLNGSESAPVSLFKLSNEVAIAPNFNNISLSGYVVENDNFKPQSIQYKIERYHVDVVDIPGEGENEPTQEEIITVDATYNSEIIAFDSIAELITSEDNPYLINLENIGFTEAGNYRITIKFIGNGNEQLSSEIIENTELVRLETSNPYTRDGIITWSQVDMASTYSVRITDKNNNVTDINSLQLSTISETISEDVTNTLVQLTEADLITETSTFKFNVGEEYRIQVMANGESLSSTWSAPFTVKKLKAPTNLKVIQADANTTILDKDGNQITINTGDPMLTWDDPNNVVNKLDYSLKFGNEAEELVIYNTSSDGSAEILGQLLPKDKSAGEYELKLKIIGNSTAGTLHIGLLTSNYSGEDILNPSVPETPETPDGEETETPDGDGTETPEEPSAPVVPATPNPKINYVNDANNVGVQEITLDDGSKVKGYTWDSVIGAYAYKLTFRDATYDNANNRFIDGDIKYITYVSTNKYTFKNTEFTGSGYYTLTVNAITNPSISIVSTKPQNPDSPAFVNYNTLYKTKNIDELFVKDGKIAWLLNISDIDTYLNVHYYNEDSIIYKHFNGLTGAVEGEEGEESGTITVAPCQSYQELRERVLAYIVQKMSGVNTEFADNAEVNSILSHIYNFRMTLNGVETQVLPNTAKVVDVMEIKTQGVVTDIKYVEKTSGYQNTHKLMFTYDLTNETVEGSVEGTQAYIDAGKYTINISPIGNMLAGNTTTGEITTTDGRYEVSKELTTYKPMTPETWVDSDYANQISNGELLWKLVANDDSSIENGFKYHKDYEIIVTSTENTEAKYSARVNIDDTEDGEGNNPNLTDQNQYRKDLKELFSHLITPNLNYTITINVAGTKDSNLLNSGEKVYLNSNIFAYRDQLNILKNLQLQVTDSVFSWDYCLDSSATKVVIYGPFDYAPDIDNYKDENGEVNAYDYNQALLDWKNEIREEFENAVNGAETTRAFREELLFEANVGSANAQRPNQYTLTNNDKYEYGSYIIRKQEIGNGKGIISTDFSDDLFIQSGSAIEPYGVIATKLNTIIATTTAENPNTHVEEDLWVVNGKFTWNPVSYANAYEITLEELTNGEVTDTKYIGIVRDTFFDMPEDVNFNDLACSYRIVVTAMRVEDDNRVCDNYFNGDRFTTKDYGRAKMPDDVSIEGSGKVTWDSSSYGETVKGYQIQINANDQDLTFTDGEDILNNSQKSYELGGINENGTIIFRVRSLAKDFYLNSMYAPALTVTKLPNPNTKVVEGVFDWKTDSGEISGQNPSDSILWVEYDSVNVIDGQEHGIDIINYPLFTTIDSYYTNYNLSSEPYAPGVYKFKVQFKGDEGAYDYQNPGYKIASKVEEFTATKLPAPILENLDFNSSDALGSGNRLTWSAIPGAGGYRAMIFALSNVSSGDTDEDVVAPASTLAEELLVVDTINNADYFELAGNGKINLLISKIVDFFDKSEDGIDIKIYVQAIGSLDSREETEPYYISSSYSDGKAISIPSKPTGYDYDFSLGKVSWELDERNIAGKYNAIVSMSYNVTGVTRADYLAYWAVTSDEYFNVDNLGAKLTNDSETAYANRFSEIISRKLSSVTARQITVNEQNVTVYDLVVLDTVFLNGRELGATPTSYQLTNIGTNYDFEIVITAGDENYKGKYQSLPLRFNTDASDNAINMAIFGGDNKVNGDGSVLLPYVVESASEFNRIRNFTDRHFVIIKDIELPTNTDFTMITNDFTGSITGAVITEIVEETTVTRYPVISNVKANVDVTNFVLSNTSVYFDTNSGIANIAMINKIAENASISNLTFDINYTLEGMDASNLNIQVAGLAITNNGAIDNVHITGKIYASCGTVLALEVGGLVVENNGVIENSSVAVGTNEISSNGIYAFDTGSTSTLAGGIAVINNDTIANTHFSGDISSNYIGGIAVNNYGDIDKCSVEGNAHIYDANPRITNDTNYKGSQFGGVANTIFGGATITNSYSLMKVIVTRLGENSGGYIGGLVAFIDPNTTTSNITITNNYVVDRFVWSSANNKGTITKAYALMNVASNVVFDNNYYIVETIGGVTNITPSQTENAGITSTNIDGLKQALANLKDGEGNNIYNVTGTYPVHN